MIKKVNLHYKRFSAFLSYLKEHDAEITIHHKSPNGHTVPITYSFKKNKPNIKSLICEAIDENESIVNEYFRKNITAHNISTRKRKIFFDNVNVIHDIQSILPDEYDATLKSKLLRGQKLDLKQLLQLYPGLNESFYDMVSKFYWKLLFNEENETYLTNIPSFIFSKEIKAIQENIDHLRKNEDFIKASLALIASAANCHVMDGSYTTHYPDYAFIFDRSTDISKQLHYQPEIYDREIPLDNETCQKVFFGSYLFADIPVIERPVHYLAQIILTYYEYFSLNLLATYLIKKDVVRFMIYTSLDGINIEYCKDRLTLNELADELRYYHFHKDPEKIFSKDLAHLLNEELKKNKTDNHQNIPNTQNIKVIIENRLIDSFSKSFLKSFGFKK